MDLGWFEVALNVSDIARSRAFYETMGFEAHEDGAGNGYVALHKNDCSLTLYQSHLEPERPQLNFWQGDVSAIAADLSAQGLSFARGPDSDDTGTSAMLIDPDGHPIFFITMKKYGDGPDVGPDGRRGQVRQYPASKGIDLGWFEFSLPAVDPIASRAFYQSLGFQPVGETDTLVSNDCRIALSAPALARPHLVFWQGDVDAIERELTARGLVFQPRHSDDRGTSAMLLDPDGHPLYFINRRGQTRKEPRV